MNELFATRLARLDDKPELMFRPARGLEASLRCYGGNPPPTPNYYQETSDTLNAQVANAPALYASEAQYQPQYAQLNLNNLNTLLNGGGGQPGVVQQETQNVIPAEARAQAAANTTQRTADINDVQTLGPQLRTAQDAANPGAAGLLATMTTQAQAGLNAGSGLTADQTRGVNNSVNASAGARGVAYGPAASYAEVLANSQFGNQLQQQRTQTATGALGANQSFYGDPFQAILGRPSTATGSGAMLLNQGQGMQPGRQFNPDDPTAMGQWSNYYNEMANYNAANSPMAIFGDVMNGIGAVVGGVRGTGGVASGGGGGGGGGGGTYSGGGDYGYLGGMQG